MFKIDGYFVDDGAEFSNYLVTEFDNTPEGYADDQIFYYGLSESGIQEAIASRDPVDDFIITGYAPEKG